MIKSSKPLLSIVIPTRNRKHYALSAVKSILSMPSDDLELILRDNSDANDLNGDLKAFQDDRRFHYTYAPPPLSAFDNFNLALNQATGQYLCVMGDDDVLNPEIIAACQWAASENVEAITSHGWSAAYYWPDYRSVDTGTALSGKLRIQEFTGELELVDPELELRRCAITGGIGMQRLPKLYLGVLSRLCLLETLKRLGPDPVGTCPDMTYAVSAASATKRVFALDYPLVVPGISSSSAAGAMAARQHQGRLEDAFHLRARKNYQWPDLIPRFYSFQTFYAESALSALKATGRTDLIRKFNLPFLYAVCAVSYPKYLPFTVRSLRYALQTTDQPRFRFLAHFPLDIFSALKLIFSKRLARRRSGVTRIKTTIAGIKNSEEATQSLSDYLIRAGRRFDERIR